MYKKLTSKIAILMKFQYELYSEGHSSHFETFYCIYLTHEYSHILPESFFEPTTIHGTQFFVQNFSCVIKDGKIQLSNIQADEFALVFQANESLQCINHTICPCISNKQMCNSHNRT